MNRVRPGEDKKRNISSWFHNGKTVSSSDCEEGWKWVLCTGAGGNVGDHIGSCRLMSRKKKETLLILQ